MLYTLYNNIHKYKILLYFKQNNRNDKNQNF